MSRLRDLIQKSIKEVPYEGKEVDIDGIKILIEGLLKGILTESKKYELTNKGYFKDDKYFSRQEVINKFLLNL